MCPFASLCTVSGFTVRSLRAATDPNHQSPAPAGSTDLLIGPRQTTHSPRCNQTVSSLVERGTSWNPDNKLNGCPVPPVNPDRQRIGPSVPTTGSTRETDWLPISAAEAGKKNDWLVVVLLSVWMKSHITSNVEEKRFARLHSTKKPGCDRTCRLILYRKPASSTVVLDQEKCIDSFSVENLVSRYTWVLMSSYHWFIFTYMYTTKRQHRANVAPTEVRKGQETSCLPSERVAKQPSLGFLQVRHLDQKKHTLSRT